MKNLLMILFVSLLATSCKKEKEVAENYQFKEVNIMDYGAKADGATDNSVAIQAAIDDCHKGGGKVIVPAGSFMTKPIFLKSNVELHLEKGSEILAIANFGIYNEIFYPNILGSISPSELVYSPALIFAENAENIKLTGEGTINGRGENPVFPQENNKSGRPRLMIFLNCKNILVEGVTLTNSAGWVQQYLLCDGVVIRKVKVYSFANYNNDGIDIDSKNVLIEDCYIESDDDGICLKSDLPDICENVVIRNCTIKSNCNALKLGTSSFGGFKNIHVSNCKISGAPVSPIWKWQDVIKWGDVKKPITAISGIAIECVDGGSLEDVKFTDIEMVDVQTPIFIRLGNRSKKYSGKVSRLANVEISNIKAQASSRIASSIVGVEGSDIQNVLIKNIELTLPGGGKASDATQSVPVMDDAYPENRMYGVVLPASAFYVRNAQNITFQDIKINMESVDTRSFYYFDKAKNISITNGRPVGANNISFIRQRDVDGLTVDGQPYTGGQGGGPTDPLEPSEIGPDGTFTVGLNKYQTYKYGNLIWMVSNSKEGNASGTTYPGRPEGENGFYYAAAVKTAACPKGWRLPTKDEATALVNEINADKTGEKAKWWMKEENGAFGGGFYASRTDPNTGTWDNLGKIGIWRVADAAGNENWTISSDKATGQIKMEESAARVRWFSVRCVKIQ